MRLHFLLSMAAFNHAVALVQYYPCSEKTCRDRCDLALRGIDRAMHPRWRKISDGRIGETLFLFHR